MSSWHRFDQREELDRALAAHIAGCLQRDLDSREWASLAVSGGSTPRGMFQRLAACDLAWQRVAITLVDERWVPPDHADSNERLVRENLLQQHAAAARLVGLKTPDADAAEGLAASRKRIADLPLPFSAVVLGMGGDGHTASWFPRAENLQALLAPPDGAAVAVTDPVTAPHQRITLTLPAVLDSREIIVHITGEDKRSILEAAEQAGHPVAAVTSQRQTPVSIWWAP